MKSTTLLGLVMTLLSSHALATSNFNKTDLGLDGNSYVLKQHEAFVEKTQLCLPQDEEAHYRVVLQGFSLFSGVDMNISGAVVDTFSDIPLKERSLLKAEGHGTRVSQSIIEISGQKIEVCLVVSEVLWDLAAANLIHIVQNFRPDFVIMSGRGGKNATIETGARNQASTLAGYSYNGNYSGNLNRPRTRRVDQRFKSSKVIPATWNYEKIKKAIQGPIENLDQKVVLGKEGRRDNDYICNNIHYSLLQASTLGNVELAGGNLISELNLEVNPAMGFFHYPSDTLKNDREKELLQWKEVIVELIKAQFNL